MLTTDNYKDAVLKAVNLGEDTDTTAAVTGGLAGLLYGLDNIPNNWKKQIAKHDDIEELAERLGEKIANKKKMRKMPDGLEIQLFLWDEINDKLK